MIENTICYFTYVCMYLFILYVANYYNNKSRFKIEVTIKIIELVESMIASKKFIY